jgi:hypothetical protein
LPFVAKDIIRGHSAVYSFWGPKSASFISSMRTRTPGRYHHVAIAHAGAKSTQAIVFSGKEFPF